MTTSTIQNTFATAFDSATKIDFDPSWANNTGYFDGAVFHKLESGKRAAAVDPTGRRIIMVGTPLGTCVAFERYTPDTGSSFVVVSNVPNDARTFIPSGRMDDDTLFNCFGSNSRNLGTALNLVVEANRKVA